MTQNEAQIEATRTAAALVRAFIAGDLEGMRALLDENEAASFVCGVLVSWLVVACSDPEALDRLMLHLLPGESP